VRKPHLNESSFRRLLLRFALLPIFSLCVVLAVLGIQLRRIAVSRFAGAQATTILLESHLAEQSILSEETGIRGYLVSHDPTFLQPYRESVGHVQNDLSQLGEEASADPAFSAKVAAIAEQYRRFDAVNQALLQEKLPDESAGPLLQQEKAAMDQLRMEFIDLNARQTAIREANRKRISTILGKLPVIGVSGGVLIAIVLLWYGRTLFREITLAYRRQLNETELQRDSLDTTLNSIGDAVMVCDAAGRITMLNPVAESLTGWTKPQAVGRPLPEVFRIVHEYTRETVENPVDKVRRLNSVVALENHTILIRRDGTEIPIDDSGAPIRNQDGSLSGVVLVFRNVAERRQAATLIRQSQERLNSIYNTSLEYIGILSPEGRVLDCNRASLEFAGNTRADVLGKFFWDCPWFTATPGMPEAVYAAIRKAAAGEAQRQEMALIRPNGEVVNFDFSLSPAFDAEGNITYLVPEGRDISELKRAEQALLQSEKLAAVGRLATSIAHEINNPLESVTNLIYLARHDPTTPEIEKYLNAADHELRRVSVIVSQTLRFHKQSSNPEPIQASELFATVLSIFEGRLRNLQIEVEAGHRTDEPVVCFAGDVRQVLNNLVANAIDAMDRKGRLLLRSHASTDWATNRKGITITVADTGAGISRDDLSHIFEPFFTTKGIGGTGLGLWVSKEVVARHQGRLNVRSCTTPGKSGTVFRFFLPHAPEPPQ
jgi:PAS domain S-box-containing protein